MAREAKVTKMIKIARRGKRTRAAIKARVADVAKWPDLLEGQNGQNS